MTHPMIETIKNARQQAGRAIPKKTVSPASQGRLMAVDMSDADKLTLLNERASFAGSKLHQASDVKELKSIIASIIQDKSKIAIGGQAQLTKRLTSPATELVPPPCQFVPNEELANDETLFNVDVTITDVLACVAETGSIALAADQEYTRLSSLVAQIHIALIWPDQIVSDLIDLSTQFTDQGHSKTPGGYTLISGPSKTADIELNLVVGVHGPGELHLIIMSE